MTQAPEKLAAICFHTNTIHPMATNLYEVLLFSLLSQLSLGTPLLCQDYITGAETMKLDEKLAYNQLISALQKISRNTRCRYVLSGAISAEDAQGIPLPVEPEMNATVATLRITLRLFDFIEERFLVDELFTFSNFKSTGNAPQVNSALDVSMSVLGATVNQMAEKVVCALFPNNSKLYENTYTSAPLCQSYQAINYVVQANKKSDYADKTRFYEAALKADPAFEIPYAQLAKITRLQRDYEKSVYYYRKALETSRALATQKAQYCLEAGIGCALLGKQDLATQWWERALQLDPTQTNAYLNLANLYEDMEQLEKACEYFQKAQESAPNDPRTYTHLARMYSKLGQWERALIQYQKQLKTEEDPWSHSDMATCYLNMQKPEEAAVHLKKAAELDPEGEAGEYARLILSCLN